MTATMPSLLSPKTTFPLIPPGGLCVRLEDCIVVAAADCDVIAGGCHGVGGQGRALQALAFAQPPDRNGELEPSAGTFGGQRRIVVVVHAVAIVGFGIIVN